MSEAPDRIWVEQPEIFDGMGFWQETPSADLIEYTRADLLTAALARAEALENDRRFILEERDRTFALMLARAEAAEADARSWETVALSNQAMAQSHCERWALAEAAISPRMREQLIQSAEDDQRYWPEDTAYQADLAAFLIFLKGLQNGA